MKKHRIKKACDKKYRQNDNYIILFIFHRLSYTCHIENLKYYISKGMKLLNVHEIISFDQSDFAKEYISLTTALRTATSSKVKKKMWKFYNNVLFGKSLQDNAKNIDVDIVWNNRRANTKIKSSRFRGRQILDPDTLAISSTPPKISRRMAFAVGFSILEFSKLEMYQVSCTLGWRKKFLSSVGFEPTRTTVHLELNSWRLRPLGQLDEQICTQCDLGVFLFSATSFLSKHQH